MKINHYLYLVCCLIVTESFAQQTRPRVEVISPDVEQEATSIWRTINDIAFLEQQGYRIHLPSDDLIDSLIRKSKSGSFGNDDYPVIYEFVASRVFETDNYQQAISMIEDQIPLLNRLIGEIEEKQENWDWTFKTFDRYCVSLTLFGTGGSYDPDAGTITLFTTSDGGFMNYQNPANTIIHEIVHMGMEQSIVQQFNLPHGLKERVIDTFVYLLFKKDLPEYTIQNMGDPEIDQYLRNQADLGSLAKTLSSF